MTITAYRWYILLLSSAMVSLPRPPLATSDDSVEPDRTRYLAAARTFADTVLTHGRDVYGKNHTPLMVGGLHATTLKPARWHCRGETWILSNIASQQPLMRVLDGLTALIGEKTYQTAAETVTRYALKQLRAPNGLLYWGGHMAWDLLLQAGESLTRTGDRWAEVGEEFIRWASEDLKAYAKHCYDPKTGQYMAIMTTVISTASSRRIAIPPHKKTPTNAPTTTSSSTEIIEGDRRNIPTRGVIFRMRTSGLNMQMRPRELALRDSGSGPSERQYNLFHQ